MAKGRAKISSTVQDSLDPPQPRSLRSRKRGCPADEISLTDDVQASVHQQDTEGNNRAVAATSLQSSLQESMTSAQQDQAAEQQQDATTVEKHVQGSFYLENEVVKAFEGQEETTVTNPKNDSQLESFTVHTENDTIKRGKDKEEIMAEECNQSASPVCTDQLQVFLPTSEEGDESCVKAKEEQLGERENSHCDLERNPKTSQDETSQEESSQDLCMVDVKEITKEAVVAFPVRKKRRMGMCGLTEKERGYFLWTQKRENGQEIVGRVETQICNNKADLSAQEEIIPSPPPIPEASVAEQKEAEIKLQSSPCKGVDRLDTEVHMEVSTSNGTSTVCDPGCSEGESCEAEGDIIPSPEQTGDSRSDPPAEEEEAHLGNTEQKLRGSSAEIMAEIHQKQMEDGEDGRAEVETCHTDPSQNEETEKQKGGSEAAPHQVCSVTMTKDEKKEETTGHAGDGDRAEAGASSADTQPEGFNGGSVVAVTPGSSVEASCGPDDEPAPCLSAMNVEDPKTRDTTDQFGSGCLDYVSDSQLNTIVWTEEELTDKNGSLGCSDCNEDATDLICGLIRELSSLNRTVMATHRELENLRRGSKSSRSATR
ncbi:uncharacterized protein LOC121909082 [Scomber scombrus]|uniref:Uncharacterized protein LOC121909082 n=1 Tax=Scomber scombrus TaxID=13677 RepID=A0AAV1PNT0_SCOSC